MVEIEAAHTRNFTHDLHKKAKFYLCGGLPHPAPMTLLVLPRFPLPTMAAAAAWPRTLLRCLAGRQHDLPDDMEDWQLRDLALTRPRRAVRQGPGFPLTSWLP
jgi:hypothetical protein